MYRAIASVGTLLLNLGELTAGNPDANPVKTVAGAASDPSKSAVENSSNWSEIVEGQKRSENILSNETNSSKLDGRSSNSSPMSDTGSVQQRLCEALADAAEDCEPFSHGANTNDDEFIRVGSEDSLLSSPEVIDLDDDSSNQCIGTEQLTRKSEGCTKAPTDSNCHTNNSDHRAEVPKSRTKNFGHSTNNSDDSIESKRQEKSEETVPNSIPFTEDKTEELTDISEGVTTKRLSSETSETVRTRRRSSGALNLSWFITFEQFLASVLTEPLLVEYFEEQTNIEEIINTVKTEGVRDFVRDPRRSHSVE